MVELFLGFVSTISGGTAFVLGELPGTQALSSSEYSVRRFYCSYHFTLQLIITITRNKLLTLRWPRGGGGIHPPPPTGFSNFSQKWEQLFLQTKFLSVGSPLGHLPMKKFFKSDLPSWL